MSQISSLGKKTFSEKYVYGGNNELGLRCLELEMPAFIILRCTPENKKEIKAEILDCAVELCCAPSPANSPISSASLIFPFTFLL